MIVKKIPNNELNIALEIFNECFNKNNKNINIPLLGDLFGLYKNNILIGILQIDYINNFLENTKIAIINNFCIKKEFRNKGYGNFLLNECIKYLKERNIDKISLTSNKNRIYAHMLYKNNNFEIIDTIILNKDL